MPTPRDIEVWLNFLDEFNRRASGHEREFWKSGSQFNIGCEAILGNHWFYSAWPES